MLKDIVDFLVASIIGLFTWFFGGRDGFVDVLITLAVIDYIMGVMGGYKKRELSSRIGFKGIAKKMAIFCLVGVSHVIDNLIPGDGTTFRSIVSLFYISNEGLSILENADALGIPIPQFLRNRFLSMKEQVNDARTNSESR